MPLATNVKAVLKANKLAAHKTLGQNFLVHRHTAERIVDLAGVAPTDTIIELGVGLGALTVPLAARAAKVIGLEIDAGIIKWHQENGELPANVTLIHQDILRADFAELASQCGGTIKIVSNLPYSISNPLLFKLLENRHLMTSAVLMLQKEVAQRLNARVGTKEYGPLTVLLNGYAAVANLMQVGPGQFHPRPKVDSTVVKILFQPPTTRAVQLPTHDFNLLRALVNGAFGQRRKTLLNALSASALFANRKSEVRELLAKADLDPAIRAERLSVEDYVRLANLASQAT